MTDKELEKIKEDFWEKIRPPRTLAEIIAERAADYIDQKIVEGYTKDKQLIKKLRPELTDEEIEKLISEIYDKQRT